MRVERQVFDDCSNVEIELVVQRDDFADDVRFAEVLDGDGFRDQERGRILERTLVPMQVIEVENLQKCRIGEADLLVIAVIIPRYQVLAQEGARHGLDIGKLRLDQRAHRRLHRVEVLDADVELRRCRRADRVGTFVLLEKHVVSTFVFHDEPAEDIDRHADGESQDVDRCERLVLAQIPDRNLDVVPEHDLPRAARQAARVLSVMMWPSKRLTVRCA